MRASCPVLLVSALALAACHRAPTEPAQSLATTPPAAPDAPFRPPLADSAHRIAVATAALPDAGISATTPIRETLRLEVGAPTDVDVVAVHFVPPDRWVVGAVERDRVTLGLPGAERIYNVLNQSGRAPSAAQLARIVGALYYYPWRIFDGSSWTDTAARYEPIGQTTTPMLVDLPNANGRALAFTFGIPDGQVGAGPHLAHFHVTDSGFIIDQAPNPQRR